VYVYCSHFSHLGVVVELLQGRRTRRAAIDTTPDFYLRPTNIVGANINADDPETPALPKPRTTPRRGPCAKLVARVQEKRGGLYRWSAWAVESVKVDKDGDSAEAVTMDGSAGLRVVDDEWRVAWVFDSY
jgi:hypothetical protein